MNPALHIALHQVVAQQLSDGDPDEVWGTAQRLTAGQHRGYRRRLRERHVPA